MHAQTPHSGSPRLREHASGSFTFRTNLEPLNRRYRRGLGTDGGRDIYLRIGMEQAHLSPVLESRLRDFGLTFIEQGCAYEIYTIVAIDSAEWFIKRLPLEQGILSVEAADPPSCK